MSQLETHSRSNNIQPLVDPAIQAMESQIGQIKKTITELAADGHEVMDATKQLNEMIEKLRIMKSRARPI
jgi:hypothetical protein